MKEEQKTKIDSFISSVRLGESQKYDNMELIPLFRDDKPRIEFISLKQALAEGSVKIIETTESGVVSKLKVINKGNKRVLIIDGEEFAGAKQNRIINTTVLLRANSELIIPVSCTEQGRWNYKTPEFNDSGVVASHRIRKDKSRSVTANLKSSMTFDSNQSEVWNNVQELLDDSNVHSGTSAMKEVFEQRGNSLNEYLSSFKNLPGQKGMLVLIDGRIAGMDYVALKPVFNDIYEKLLKSYAMEAAIASKNKLKSNKRHNVYDFLSKLSSAEVSKFKSIGHGDDLRFEGDKVGGNALKYQGKIIHFSAFSYDDEGEKPRRRGFDMWRFRL
jgi:hypothetical protein